jgi:hypothetical protein
MVKIMEGFEMASVHVKRFSHQSHFFRTGIRPTQLTVLAVMFMLVLGFAVLRTANAQDFAARARDYVASRQGLAIGELQIIEATRAHLPLTGVELAEFKVLTPDGRSFGVSFDVATADVLDPLAAAARERQARTSAYGKLAPTLYDRLQRNAAERLPVAIWVAMPDPGPLARNANPDLTTLAARVRAAQTPAADAARRLGVAIELADLVPVIFAELNVGLINALAHHPAVVAIDDIPQHRTRHSDDDGATSNRYPFIWSTAAGGGAKVAVHEDDGVDNVNPFLNNATHNVIYWNTNNRNIGDHATNVGGVIASTHNWRRGGAFGIAQILSANFQSFFSTQNIVNSASWAINNGADTINMSWGDCSDFGGQNFDSRWVDYLVKTFGVNIVVSSGNNNCGTPDFVASPSLGWNTLSVGSYYDKNTGLRSDDVLSLFTSYKNPTDPNSGRTYEKPDVTGMGGNTDKPPPNHTTCFGVETTAVGGGVTDSTCGTSFSAPDVAALTALVVGKNPAGLRRNAEAVKAIIMAGATHNVVDGKNYMDCPALPVPGDCRDGAGAIDAYQTIQNVVVPGNWRFPGFITPDSFDPAGNLDFPVSIGSGKDIRAAIAWDSTAVCANLGTTSQSCTSDVLNADLDLHLIDPSGIVVASSLSFQNSAEVIDYKTTTSGTYTIRVHNFRFDAGTNTYLGVAWNLNTVDSRNPLTGVTSFTLNTTKTSQTTDKGRSFWDKYSGPATSCASFLNAETGLEKVYQITTPSTGKITATLSSIAGFSGVNSDVDVIILKKSGSANSQNTQVVGCGETTAIASNQPAGTYYIVVDGSNGSVAKFSLTVNFSAGTAVAAAEETLDISEVESSLER